MIGKTLSHYKIIDEISRGGMGIVYRAVDVNLNREVALKVLPPDLVADRERRERFVKEAQAAAALEHPNIATIYEIDEADGHTFIVMELIRGEKLSDIVEQGKPALSRSLEIATEVAEGMACAHDKGILHRDLKPANVMVTGEGHAKIIDFGLAKLVEPLRGFGSEVETAFRGEQASEGAATDPGVIMGTVSYMSPEQARGVKLDHRSDIFSFGIVLYELIVGQVPFRGPTGMDTLQAILSQPAPPLPDMGSGVSSDAGFEIHRVVEKCLAKDPVERYQSMNDLVVDLRSARRRLESGSLLRQTGPVAPAVSIRKRPWSFVAGVVAAVALLVAGLVLFLRPGSVTEPIEAARPSVAVLYFENTTGEPSLDWLRTGLTDMLVTDLSQSPQLEVLSTDRLYHILSELNREDERITSLEVVQEVADRAGVETVILGSFMKAGESIRINIRVQEARSGKILSSEKVEGVGEENLFPMVDELTRRIKTNFETSSADAEPDMDLKDVTTSSIEAYRYYAEGLRLHNRGRFEEAIPLLEMALEFDPEFAMALAKLAIVHGNLFHRAESDQYAELALENVDRLTLRERYYIEGLYYDRRPETHERSIEAYKKAIELDPRHASARHNLARRHLLDERYDEAIPHFEELRRQRMSFPDTYAQLADAYAVSGELEKGREILEEFIDRNPESAAGLRNLARHSIMSGKLEEALGFLEKAEILEPGNMDSVLGRWTIFSLSERWEEAEAAVEPLKASRDPSRKWMSNVYLAAGRLYRGRLEEALAFQEEALNAFPQPGPFSAIARAYVAETFLIKGEPEVALDMATKALEESDRTYPQQLNLRLAALTEAELGQWENAEKFVAEYKRRAESLTPVSWEREAHRLVGELALVRGDTAEAIRRLEQAVSLLSQRGALPPPLPPHVPIWFSLASAYLAAGQEDQAAEWFGRIMESSVERNLRPVEYIRSFYFLGKIRETQGDMEKAREYYRRFYEFWKDGDIDRERVDEVQRKL